MIHHGAGANRFSIRACLFIYLLLACLPFASAAPVNGNHEQAVSAQQIDTIRKAAESDTNLDEERKKKTLELLDQAAQWLQQATESKAQLDKLKVLVKNAPQRIEAITSGKARGDWEMPPIDKAVASGNLEQNEKLLQQEQTALQLARETQRTEADELARLLVSSKSLSEEIASLTKKLERIGTDLQAEPKDDEPSVLTQAHDMVLKTRRQLRQSELDIAKLRLANHDLLTNLAQAERDQATAEITVRQKRLDTLRQAVQQLRDKKVQQAQAEAESLRIKTESLPPPLQAIAKETAAYRSELQNLLSREQTVTGDLQVAQLGLDEMKSDFERTRQRVDVVGASKAIGKLLKRRRDALPSAQSYRRTSAARGSEISHATDRQIEIDELLLQHGDPHEEAQTRLLALPEADRAQYAQDSLDLAKAQREALNELQKVYGRYIGQITSLDLAERQLAEVAGKYIDYIDDQLIWIPGPGLTALLDPVGTGKALAWLLDPRHWADVVQDLWDLLHTRTPWLALLLVAFLVLLWKQKMAQQRLQEIAKVTYKISTDSFLLTLKALGYTLVAISAWPLLLLGGGWMLASLPTASPHSLALAGGMLKAGLILLSIRFLIRLCMPDSVGDRHLRWPPAVRMALIHELNWILPIAVPLGFLLGATAGNELPQPVQSFGRLAFIGLMVVNSLFTFRLLRRQGKVMQTLETKGGTLNQLHFLWFPLMVIMPILFALTSALGYHYTAIHLELRAEQTFWFFFGLFLVKELLLRSLYIAERRLRYEDAIRRRDELRAQRAKEEAAKEEETSPIAVEIPEIDFDELGEQNKRLVRAGFMFGAVIGIWSIWSDLLPALGFLNATELPLHATRIVDGISKEVPVTLGDLTMGLIMMLITILAAKNIPGVLEIALLQRLPLDSGARYAITSLTQYLIVGIGVFTGFSTLGLQWSNIQWLVAALSVGLGFGLQEIVANFISGIILLFERPIRVGDVVTIENITGKVARIRIRATTIINWDKQELLIPNKEFITGRVINWTLSDKINRLVITIGIAYGSDVQKAMDLMMEAARENPHVLDDPAPVVTFDAFGDNSLTLVLRSYLGSMDDRLSTMTALNKAINAKFNAAGISIAFPQRDIHLDTGRPLDVRLHPVAGATGMSGVSGTSGVSGLSGTSGVAGAGGGTGKSSK